MAEPQILFRDHEVVPALTAMQLERDRLIEVLRFADAQRALCTSNDVAGFGLITAHDKAVRGLREQFCGKNWVKDEVDNQAGIFNEALGIRVICCNFDINAGNLRADPANRVLKGYASRKKVRCNRTGWLPNLPLPKVITPAGVTTWVLGMFTEDNLPLSGELSLPLSFAEGKFSQFVRRIVLLSDGKKPDAGLERRLSPAPVETVNISISRK